MNRVSLIALVFASSALLAGCSAASVDTSDAELVEPAPVETQAEGDGIPWENYPPALKAIIDQDAAAADCVALQDTFDVWANSDDTFREEFGVGNSALMAYIDQAMIDADCYE